MATGAGVPVVDLDVHHKASGLSDRLAYGFTKALRFCADTFFAKRYGHRAIVLETVAAVPGMVGATLTHLRCLRNMCDDRGWIRTLMEEAENERMHLMTFIQVAKPTLFERCVILGVQWMFYLAFFALYLVSAPRTAWSAFSRKRRWSATRIILRSWTRIVRRTCRRRRSPGTIGDCRMAPRYATWSWSSERTRRIIAT